MSAQRTELPYTTAYINRNFLLKVSGTDNQNRRINKLVGVSGLVALLGEDLAGKCIDRALKSSTDKVKCCFRRGLRVTLYFK